MNNFRHFEIHPLAEGVFAAIARDGYASCNAGLIDLGDRTLIFDTFLTPAAAADLCVAAETLTGRSPEIVLNSHCHNDHFWGNQVFATGALILASGHTRRLMAAQGPDELQFYAVNGPTRLEALRQQYQAASTPEERAGISLFIEEYEGILADLPVLTLQLPHITLDSHGTVHGSARSVELIEFDRAHTESDLVLYLPQERIAFLSDILFVNCHPYLGDGDPLKLLAALEEINRLDAEILVPGHGPVGSRSDLHLMAAYVGDCLEIARKYADAGAPPEEFIDKLVIPEKYRSWMVSRFYRANVQALYRYVATPHNGSS